MCNHKNFVHPVVPYRYCSYLALCNPKQFYRLGLSSIVRFHFKGGIKFRKLKENEKSLKIHSQNKTKQLVFETPYVTAPVYALAQLTGWRSPIFISEDTHRSLRILTAVRGTESRLKEPTTDQHSANFEPPPSSQMTFCVSGNAVGLK